MVAGVKERKGRRKYRVEKRWEKRGVGGKEKEKEVRRRVEKEEKENKRLVHDVTASIRPD